MQEAIEVADECTIEARVRSTAHSDQDFKVDSIVSVAPESVGDTRLDVDGLSRLQDSLLAIKAVVHDARNLRFPASAVLILGG